MDIVAKKRIGNTPPNPIKKSLLLFITSAAGKKKQRVTGKDKIDKRSPLTSLICSTLLSFLTYINTLTNADIKHIKKTLKTVYLIIRQTHP